MTPAAPSAATPAASPFLDLDAFVAIPRCTGLALSPDGTRLISAITRLNGKQNGYTTALWELPTGRDGSVEQPVRLTRGTDGEALVALTPAGDVLFTGKRHGPEEDDEDVSALRRLPARGGESLTVLRYPGSLSEVLTARDADTVVIRADVLPSVVAGDAPITRPEVKAAGGGARSSSADVNERPRDQTSLLAERREKKVSGVLHESFPVRSWDHDLGPGRPQLLVVEDPSAEEWTVRRLTSFGPEDRLGGGMLSADGRTVYASLTSLVHGTTTRTRIIAIDVADGALREVAAEEDRNLHSPVLSRDGSTLLASRSTIAADGVPLDVTLARIDQATGAVTDVTRDLPGWPGDVVLADDGSRAWVSTDKEGHGAIWEVDVADGRVRDLTRDAQHYTHLAVDQGSGDLHALADAIDAPPRPVVLRGGSLPVEDTPSPVERIDVPGTLTEVTATAADGTALRAWLCLPEGADAEHPAPTLLWIHGGPFGSWNSWTWRWNPWTAVARGYAVLLPDPAISTGYGPEMIERGWSELGGAPFEDIVRLTDAALEREDLDETRTAAMGGSYGGYMANWVAGHTGDRFRCVVTHASLWALEQFRGTTDTAEHWTAHLSDRHNALFSPHAFVGDIEVPMLVIHGDKDYRVPIGEGLRLWYELLAAQQAQPGGNPHRFLYFPDEGHWILKPGNSALWYETVYAFLAQHVLGEEWVRPKRLG